jgi:hypothetical protein
MKKIFFFSLCALGLYSAAAQSVGIGTSTPHTSAALEINSSSKGLLLPRVNDTNSISSPAKGLIIYRNADNKNWFYDGSRWQPVAAAGGGSDSIWYKAQDSIAYTAKKYAGINSGALLPPQANLQVGGSLLVRDEVKYSAAAPTEAQTYTMENSENFFQIPAADSVVRIYDPGGTVNYNNNTIGNIEIREVADNLGYLLQFNPADFGLGTGDTLWLTTTYFPFCRDSYFYRLTGSMPPQDITINGGSVNLVFRSNNTVAAKGFDVKVTRLFAPGMYETGGAGMGTLGNGFYFSKGSLGAGFRAQANGARSVAMGMQAKAGGTESFAIGAYAETQGQNTMAIGYLAKARFNYATAVGYNVQANGNAAFAAGNEAIANGASATAIGYKNRADGTTSFAAGINNIAKFSNLTVVGAYNDTSLTNAIFQIGCGYGPNPFNQPERLTAISVAQGGNVGIGTLYPQSPLQFANTIANRKIVLWENNWLYPGDYYGFGINGGTLRYNTPNFANHIFYANNNPIFTIFYYGNATLAGSLFQNSDQRLKKDITPLAGSLAQLIKLNGYTYYWKSEQRDSLLQIGVLAQDVQRLYPQLVRTDKEGNLSVNYAGLTPVLIEAVKELNVKLETQQQQNLRQAKALETLEVRLRAQQQQLDVLLPLLKNNTSQHE